MLRSDGLKVTTITAALLLAALVAVLVLWGAKPAEATFPGANGRITFVSDRPTPDNTTDYEIYVMNSDGTGTPTLLTNNTVIDSNPAFAPNGTTIAFDTYRDDPANANIYKMSASDSNQDGNGDNLKRLTKKSSNDEEPAFSPSGTKIAFTSDRTLDGNTDIYVMKAKPEGRRNRPKNLTRDPAFDAEPSFSPDGTKIVFTSDRSDSDGDIFVMNSDGTGLTQLTSDPAFDADAVFSPDGKQIVFRSGRNGTDTSEVYVMGAVDNNDDGEGDNMTNLSNDSAANDAWPAFSPDGTKVVFRSDRTTGTGVNNTDGDREIFVINVNGTGLTQLTNNDDEDTRPDWGPLPQ